MFFIKKRINTVIIKLWKGREDQSEKDNNNCKEMGKEEILNAKKVVLEYAYLKKYIIYLCIIYTVAMSAIIRADFKYYDDLLRIEEGSRLWDNYSRYISNILSVFLHGMTYYLTDISPLTQFLTIVMLALASSMVISIFVKKEQICFLKYF